MKGYYYSNEKRAFIVRTTIDGRRVYVGKFDSETEAERALLRVQTSLLDRYKLYYERQDTSLKFLDGLRVRLRVAAEKRKRARKASKQTESKLRSW